ncbi:MAG: hypothetical protein K8S27_10745 [Candidatus Omnitrophica bacterium]|nr:hypothetical protein [Candidatus Omnitrophota bacterium]
MNSEAWQNNECNDQSFSTKSPKHPLLTPLKNSISVYVGLKILLRMRACLGLEAMLQYMEQFVDKISKRCPELDRKTNQALNDVDVRKLFHDL